MQRFGRDAFWNRYGDGDFEETDFAKAVSTLSVLSAEGPWLCGGAVRRFFLREGCDSDFDLFFRDQEQFERTHQWLKDDGGTEVSENDFNVTVMLRGLKVQLIRIQFYPNIEAVLASFDFSLCQFGYDGSAFWTGPWALWDTGRKRLVPEQVTYATSTLRRIIKYTRQGYAICSGGLGAILQQVADDPSIIQQNVEYID